MMHFLKDKRVILRKLSPGDDLENYLRFANDVNNLIWIAGLGSFPLNKDDLIGYIKDNKGLFLAIFDSKKNIHVGNVLLSHIDFQHRNAMLGVLIGSEFKGKGYAKRAYKLVIKHAFEVLNLHRIYSPVISGNKAAIGLYEKLGFTKEGIEKDTFLCNFKYYDFIIYRILEDEYKKMKKDRERT